MNFRRSAGKERTAELKLKVSDVPAISILPYPDEHDRNGPGVFNGQAIGVKNTTCYDPKQRDQLFVSAGLTVKTLMRVR